MHTQKNMTDLQEQILDVAVLVDIARNSLAQFDTACNEVDDAKSVLRAVSHLFNYILDDCDRLKNQ